MGVVTGVAGVALATPAFEKMKGTCQWWTEAGFFGPKPKPKPMQKSFGLRPKPKPKVSDN